MIGNTFFIVSLGCAKNTVDSESMSLLLQKSGYKQVFKPREADVLIVNTCGFIHPARQESIHVLQELNANRKKSQLLIAAGCMSKPYHQVLTEEISGIDGIISTHMWANIVDFIHRTRTRKSTNQPSYHLPDLPQYKWENNGVRQTAVQGGSAYLKIADGCRRKCAFCAIPLIKGPSVSRSIEAILKDASYLQEIGIKEMILISQDTTDYGTDLGIIKGLTYLLERIVQLAPNIPWIRLLYAFPGCITDELIDMLSSNPQLLHYIDIPLQHAHPDVLKRMGRPSNIDWAYRTIEKMRSLMPDISLRTTFILGYPGETDWEFQMLLKFVSDINFDHVGAFVYSQEKGTPSAQLTDDVPSRIKEERLSHLMAMQEKISLNKNRTFIGKTLDVLIEGHDKHISIGRSYRDAPEIDGLVILEGRAKIGEIAPVMINGAMTHDLTGKLAT